MSRIRSLLIAGLVLAVVAVGAVVVATRSSASTSKYVTTSAATGSVTQSFASTGTVTRTNTVEAAFAASGTVSKVNVAVGDQVKAGDVLAQLDTASLKLALLQAETDLADAKASQYSAEHPSAISSGRGSSSLPSSLPTGSGSSGSTAGGISATDAAKLYEAIGKANAASLAWSNPQQPTTCDLVYSALLKANTTEPTPSPTPTPTPTPSDTGSPSPTPSPTPSETDTPTPTPTPSETETPTPTPTPTETETDTPSPTPTPTETEPSPEPTETAEPLSLTVDSITMADITACGKARENLVMANAVLADYYQQLLTTGTISDGSQPSRGGSSTGSAKGSSSSSSSSSKSSSSSVTPSVSEQQVAAAKASVLRATQAVDAAQAALDDADLVAPIAGTVGALGLTVGGSATSGSVTIVGAGDAVVSIEVPLSTRSLLKQGMAATVTPAGASESLPGTVSQISVLETEGTSGDNPTYTTTVAVPDANLRLLEGAKAAVELATRTANDVVVVPVSAVTPTGTGTGTVQVVDSPASEEARTVEVKTGAVGAGRVEITEGLTAGELVVLSDRTAALPTTNPLTATRRTESVTSSGPR